MDDNGRFHAARMAAAQSVFKITRPSTHIPCRAAPKIAKKYTGPRTEAEEIILDRFWRRVADLTTRYYDAEQKWIGGVEIRKWNKENRNACDRCTRSRISRVCEIDENHPSCRSCRSIKVGCDRKPRFVFDMTKNEFYSDFDHFMAIFHKKEAGRLKRYVRVPRNRNKPTPRWPQGAPDMVNGESVSGTTSASALQLNATHDQVHDRQLARSMLSFLTTDIRPILLELQQAHSRSGCVNKVYPSADRLEELLSQIDEFEKQAAILDRQNKT
ncbi:hypothetical protein C8R43DRAFT_1005413 [Mycena crocata]|nr:hypothetical protein C8R43DRAFT_1005413 [Mycena crocata]